MPRIVVLIAVVGIHLALIAVFTMSRDRRRQERIDDSRMVVVFLAPAREEEFASAVPPIEKGRVNPSRVPQPVPPAKKPSIAGRLGEEATPSTSPSAPIDWMEESRTASSRQIESLEEKNRRGRGFTDLEASRQPSASTEKKPDFRWSEAHTKRIEPLPDGGTLVRINERCALVVKGMLFPVCKLGKIEAHGDLFEHMKDEPALGDWKEEQ